MRGGGKRCRKLVRVWRSFAQLVSAGWFAPNMVCRLWLSLLRIRRSEFPDGDTGISGPNPQGLCSLQPGRAAGRRATLWAGPNGRFAQAMISAMGFVMLRLGLPVRPESLAFESGGRPQNRPSFIFKTI